MKKIHEIIVDQIIEKLEEWIVPWQRTWQWWVPINYSNNNEYKWINRLLLSMNDFKTNYYLTYNQIKNLKWNINKWSKATKIIYWDIKNKAVGDEDITDENNKKIITKYYNVFNIEQTDIIPNEKIVEQIEQDKNYSLSKSLINNYKNKPNIIKWINPCYIPSSDTIHIPNKQSFITCDEYYSTLFHELVHSTWSKERLSREGVVQKNYYWSHKYSREELIAEIGNMFLSNYAKIESTNNNSVSYINWWLKFLKWNKRDIIIASSHAEKAVWYILKNELIF